MDQIRNVNLKGTTITWEQVDQNPNIQGNEKLDWYAVVRTNDTDPYNPQNETFKEAIDSVLENLDVRQDHIREQYPNKVFDETKNPFKYWLEINEELFQKENRYDQLLDHIIESNKMPYKNGKVLGRIV